MCSARGDAGSLRRTAYILIFFIFLFFFFSSAPADCPDSVPSSTETGGTNCLAPGGLSGKTSLVALDFWPRVALSEGPDGRRSDAGEFLGMRVVEKGMLEGGVRFRFSSSRVPLVQRMC